jgi:hypothetical protein
MLGQQIGAERGGCLIDERQVAFAVEAHRATAQVGRAYAADAVIDDHDLGMHGDRRIGQLVGDGRNDPQPVETVRLLQACDSLVAENVHRRLLEPAGSLTRQYDDDFGARCLF